MNKKTLRIMMAPALLILVIVIYYPLVRGAMLAFQNYNMFDLTNVHFIGLDNFKAVICSKSVSFLLILWNTLVWLVVSLFFQFVLGFILALLLKKPFPGRGLYSGLVFYPWALCGFAIGILWTWLFNGQFGLINDVLFRLHLISGPVGWLSEPNLAMIAVIIPNVWYGIPFFGIMLLAALQSVPKDLYEAARLDGCGWFKQLFHVTIPYIKPTIVSTVLLRIMWIVNFPDLIFAMTNGGPVNRTQILATAMIEKVFRQYDYGQGSAIGLIIMALLLVFSIFYLKLTNRKED